MDETKIQRMALNMREKILEVSHHCNLSTHLGGGLSMVEITATLYGAVLKYDRHDPAWDGRDRFILSKGHGVLGLFSALMVSGIISEEVFFSFQSNESDLIAHPVMNIPLGIEASNGSLGQGLSMAVGLAFAAKLKNMPHKIYVLLGDGECNEGAVWEGAMLAAQLKLDNLVAIIDHNKLQSDGASECIINLDDLAQKWRSFGWHASEVDGHCIRTLYQTLTESPPRDGPKVVVAHTIKGKGISFMENNNEWHHNRLTKAQYDRAIEELTGVNIAAH